MDGQGQGERIREFWDAYAQDYDSEPDHGLISGTMRRARRELLSEALPPPPAELVEMGCGTGTITEILADLGHLVTASDLSPAMVRVAKAKTARFADRVTVRTGDASARAKPGPAVDAVVARHLVWTLPNPEKTLRRWVSMVRPGGRLVLIEGQWGSRAPQSYVGGPPLRWEGGIRAEVLAAALRPHVARIEVTDLDSVDLWGRTLSDQRYLLVAHVAS